MPGAGPGPDLPGAEQVEQGGRTGSIALIVETAATRSAIRPPIRPPSVPAPATWPKWRLAVRGSNRSEAISQNPDPSIGPMPETWR